MATSSRTIAPTATTARIGQWLRSSAPRLASRISPWSVRSATGPTRRNALGGWEDLAVPPDPLRIGLLADQFPELSETFIAAEARELERQGHAVHIEAGRRAPNPNEEAAVGLDVAYIEDDGRRRTLPAMARLALRHPLRVLADLRAQPRWRREEDVRPL